MHVYSVHAHVHELLHLTELLLGVFLFVKLKPVIRPLACVVCKQPSSAALCCPQPSGK